MNEDLQDPAVLAIRRAAINVLGSTSAGTNIIQLCDSHLDTLRLLVQSRVPDATVVAVIGATGQGKSWLIRQCVADDSVRRAIRTGDSQAEATRRLYWVGPTAPSNLDPSTESFLYTPADAMLNLGGPYILVDTPGATDSDPATAEAAARAISMASVLVLVIRREQIRSEVPGQLVEASDGTLILPVVTVVRSPLDHAELRRDVDALTERLRGAAPRGEVLPPILVPDFELAGSEQDGVGNAATEQLAAALRPQLSGGQIGQRRRGVRMQAERERFQHQVRSQLAEHLPKLALTVQHLDEATNKLPHDVAVELIGSGQALRAGIRARLRAEMLVSTAAIWFPYRTILGLLNLTHGAWDRVILALSGSLPSLVGAAWTSFKNLNESGNSFQTTGAIRQRSSSMIADRIVPLVNRFRSELSRIRPSGSGSNTEVQTASNRMLADGQTHADIMGLELLGIDSLQEQTQRILDEEIANAAPSKKAIQFCGLVGSIIFWCLLAGPIVSLYRSYFSASYESISRLAENLETFPHPSAAMIFTSLLLSLLPTALFAMGVLTWVQRTTRQETAAAKIDARIKDSIGDLQAQGVLRVEFRDPILEDTRRLTQVG